MHVTDLRDPVVQRARLVRTADGFGKPASQRDAGASRFGAFAESDHDFDDRFG